MLKSGVCPHCQSHNVIPGVRIKDMREQTLCDSSSDLAVAVYDHPEALIFKGAHESTLHAWVCGTCGYTEFYADHPQKLRAASPRNLE